MQQVKILLDTSAVHSSSSHATFNSVKNESVHLCAFYCSEAQVKNVTFLVKRWCTARTCTTRASWTPWNPGSHHHLKKAKDQEAFETKHHNKDIFETTDKKYGQTRPELGCYRILDQKQSKWQNLASSCNHHITRACTRSWTGLGHEMPSCQPQFVVDPTGTVKNSKDFRRIKDSVKE